MDNVILATCRFKTNIFKGDLRNGQEVNVIEHLLGLSVLSAKDDHEHGIDGAVFFIRVDISWSQVVFHLLSHLYCGRLI